MRTEYTGPEFPELQTQNIEGVRWYKIPDGDMLPSITSVLSKRPDKKRGLTEWRERVGEVQANIISGKAARRGTCFHNCVEDFLEDRDFSDRKKENFLAYYMFQEVKPVIEDKISKVVLMEQSMYSTQYRVAGRCDFIGVFDGKLAVVDWKTTTKMKREDWMEDYFVQATSYAEMYREHTGELIDDIIIVMVAEDGQVEIFEKKTADYVPLLEEMMKQFYKYNFDIEEKN